MVAGKQRSHYQISEPEPEVSVPSFSILKLKLTMTILVYTRPGLLASNPRDNISPFCRFRLSNLSLQTISELGPCSACSAWPLSYSNLLQLSGGPVSSTRQSQTFRSIFVHGDSQVTVHRARGGGSRGFRDLHPRIARSHGDRVHVARSYLCRLSNGQRTTSIWDQLPRSIPTALSSRFQTPMPGSVLYPRTPYMA